MQDRPITVLLNAAEQGTPGAVEDLYAAVYGELKKLASANRRRWQGNRTLNTTVLIHEAYLKLADAEPLNLQNRRHFYATASKAMRQVLINYAERAGAQKRGGLVADVTLNEALVGADTTTEELLRLTQQLESLEAENPRRCRVVECRVFGGMTVEETAEALDISAATVKRDWQIASASLRRNLLESDDAPKSV